MWRESLGEFAVTAVNASQGYTFSASLSFSPTLLSTPAFFRSFVFPLACLIPQNLSLNLAVVCGSMDAGPTSACSFRLSVHGHLTHSASQLCNPKFLEEAS